MARKRGNGEGSVRYKNGAWFMRYTRPDGRRVERRTDAESKKEALNTVRKAIDEVTLGCSEVCEGTRLSDLYADICADYLVNARRVDDLGKRWKHLNRLLGDPLVDQVTTSQIRHYYANRMAEGAAPATIDRERACLRRMFSLGAKSTPPRVAKVPYFPQIQVNNVRQVFFERSEFEKLYVELPDYLRPLAVVAYWVGCRKRELLTLKRSQLDLEAGILRLAPGTTKNKEGRVVHIPDEALAELRPWDQQTRTLERETSRVIPFVFHRNGKQIKDYYQAWRSACERAGIDGRYFHDFRRTAVRNYVRSGVPEQVTMKISGHKTRSTFERYNIVNEDDLRRAARQVRDDHGPSPTQPQRTGKAVR